MLSEPDLDPPGTRGRVDLRTWVKPDPGAPPAAPGASEGGTSGPSDIDSDPAARLPCVALTVQRLSPAVVRCRDHLGAPASGVDVEITAEDIPQLGTRARGVLWRGCTAPAGDTEAAWLPTGARVVARVVGAPERFVPVEVGRADGFPQEVAWVVIENPESARDPATHEICVPGKPYLDIRARDLATGEGVMGLRVMVRAPRATRLGGTPPTPPTPLHFRRCRCGLQQKV